MHKVEQSAMAGGFFKRLGSQDRQLVSHDLDETTSFLHQDSSPTRYELLDQKNPFFAQLEFKKLRHVTISYGWFSSAMTIVLAPDEPYYSLYTRRFGSSEYTLGKRVFVTSPACGAFLPGSLPLRVRTLEHWHVFGTIFSPDAIRRELSHLLGRDIVRPVEFDPVVNFERGAGRLVKRVLNRLYDEVAFGEHGLQSPEVGILQMERSLITLVLEGLGHNYSKIVNGPERKIAPWQVRAVEEFIRQYADQPLSLGDLAAVGGVSARSLQYSFLRHRGCSPMEFLRRMRFERVREDLLEPNPGTTVTSAALRWGFLHLGRFAAEYRARFNESPSATLRQAQGLRC